jgi:hypothetical protein
MVPKSPAGGDTGVEEGAPLTEIREELGEIGEPLDSPFHDPMQGPINDDRNRGGPYKPGPHG